MKKRIISLILIICLSFCGLFANGQVVSAAKMRGDVDYDAFINTKDVLLLKRYLAEMEKTLPAQSLRQADCNNDGNIDILDARDLINYLVKQGELHIDLEDAWCTLYDWESLSVGQGPNSVTTVRVGQTSISAIDLYKHTTLNDKNPHSSIALSAKPFGVYYKNTSSRASYGRNPTVGVDHSVSINVDTTKTANSTNLRVALNYSLVENELAVAYIGFMDAKNLQKYYYKLDLNNYSEFNYFYFSGKTFTKYTKGYRRTYLPDEKLDTKTITNDTIKDIRQIYFWLESDKGLNCSPASTKGLIIDDIEYFEGANGYDSTQEDAELPTETIPENDGTIKYMAISFDDGPQVYSPTGKHYIDYYTELGEEYDAKFTHFIIGNNCDDSDIPVLKRALEKGHALENHTIGHNNLENLTLEEGTAKIKELSDWMQAKLGVTPKYLRPPFLSAYSSKVYKAVEEAGIKACIAGPCPGDYDEPSVDYEALYYQRELKDGSISLMHEHYIDNVEMVRRVIEHFKARGYEFVTIDELFKIKGVEPELNKMYSIVK